jgi:hypothetical protein
MSSAKDDFNIPAGESALNSVQKQFVHVDSKSILNHSSYKVHLKTPLENVVRVDLINLDIPMVTPNIDSTKTLMKFVENGAEKSFQVPVGHYSEEDLCEEVQRLMNMKSAISGGYLVKFLRARGKVHIHSVNVNLTSFRILVCPVATMLGFSQEQLFTDPKPEVDASDTFYQACAVSDSYVYVSNSSYIYLSIEELNHSYTDVSYDRENVEGVSTFGKIYTPVELGTFLTYHSHEYPIFREYSPLPLRRLDTLTIQWKNSVFETLEFYNVPHNFTLMFTMLDSKFTNARNK